MPHLLQYSQIVLVLLAVLSFFFAVSTSWASVDHDYKEIRIENERIMATMRDWIRRTNLHKGHLENSTHKAIASWREQLQEIHFDNEYQGLLRLNAAINSDVSYRDDYSHYHQKDYWAEPDVVLEEGGDCEDIALLKAASLLRLKWPPERMQLLVGYLVENGRKESHAVLLVITREGHQVVMRSTTDQVVPPDLFPFVPLFAVNGEGVFLVKKGLGWES
jgi:predicted transglutaminase-like cysteine proteinase